MIISPFETLHLMILFIAIAVILQSLEMIQMRQQFWPWEVIRRDYSFLPQGLRWFFDFTLNDRHFIFVLALRFIAAAALIAFPHAILSAILLLTTVLICLRYRGSFNGGSDFMTLIVLTATTLSLAFPDHPGVAFAALWYVGLQSCSSYFIGGFIKLKHKNWRDGSALAGFLGSTIYQNSEFGEWLKNRPKILKASAWIAMLFETAFPLLVMFPPLTIPTLILGLFFHQYNAAFFGLNRFFFAWVATYPALVYCAQSLQQSFN